MRRVLELESRQRRLAEARAAELETTLDSINDGVVIYDHEGKPIRQNVAATRLLGYEQVFGHLSMEERAARPRAVLVDDPDAGVEKMPLRRALGGETVRGELMRHTPAGDPASVPVYFLVSAAPISDHDGRLLGAVTSFTDVTELRRARDELELRVQERTAELAQANEALRYQATLLANVHDAVFAIDMQRCITHWNGAAEKLYGWTHDEVLGRVAPQVVLPEYSPAEAEQADLSIQQTGAAHSQFTARHRSGTPVDVEQTVTELRAETGKTIGFVILQRDITERKRAEAVLSRTAHQLEILHEIDHAVLAAESLEITARDALRRLQHALPCDRAVIALIDFDTRKAQYLVAEGAVLRAGDVPPLDTPAHVLKAMQGGHAWYIPDLAAEPAPSAALRRSIKSGIRSWAVIPMQGDGRVVGALSLTANRPDAFGADDIDLAQQIADSLAVAIHNARLLDQLRAGREQLQNLSRRLAMVQESERGYVANELYNDEGQRLSAAVIQLGMIEKETRGNRGLETRIGNLKELVTGVLADMHGLAVNLRPASLDRLGLMPGLRQYAEQLGRETKCGIQIAVSGSQAERLPLEIETTVYRIAQEALTNAVRHSHAGQIGIVATQRDGRLILIVEDDGNGFDVDEALRCGRLGILGMRERAASLGGSVTIESTPSNGTTVQIDVPVLLA